MVKKKMLAVVGLFCMAISRCFAFMPIGRCIGLKEVTLEKGFGYIYFIIMALSLVTAVICVVQGWRTLGDDPHKGKSYIIAAIGIPVFTAIVIYVFKNVLGVDLEISSTL